MEPPSQHRIEVVDETHGRLVDGTVRRAVEATLLQENAPLSEVSILFASDEYVRRLNRVFRGVDEPTDVLTFPSGEGADGDIAIAMGYAARQAQARGVPLRVELAYLAIHGALHLCGLDDATDAEADEMRRRMSRAAIAIGLPPDEAWGSILHEEALPC